MAGTWTPTDYSSQDPLTYKAAIDNDMAAAKRQSDCFCPHETTVTPNMYVQLDAGYIWDGTTLTEVAAQQSTLFVAPVTNPRIDRIAVSKAAGTLLVIAGAENVSPSAPAITAGYTPVCQVYHRVGETTIRNNSALDPTAGYITDERAGVGGLTLSTPVSVAQGGTSLATLTDGSLYVGNGTSAPVALGVATNGQIPIGSTGADPVLASLTAPAAGLTITGGAGSVTFALANDLAAVEGLAANGLAARTGTSTWEARTLTAPAAGVSVANGDGVSGNPTLSLANDLAAVEGLASNGMVARTATDTWTTRTLTAPAAGISVSNGDGVSGNPTLALANDLSALEGLGSTGIAVRSASDTWVQRTITGTSNQVNVSNGDGVSGNPTLSLPQSIDTAAAVTFGGITTSSDARAHGTLIDTGATSASDGPILEQYRSGASTNGHVFGAHYLTYKDAASTKVYGYALQTSIISNTAGACSSAAIFQTLNAGSLTPQLSMLNTGCQVRGNNTNTASPAGYIGEVLSTNTASTGTSLTTGVPANINSLTLSAGNWLITGTVAVDLAGTTTLTGAFGAITTTSATLGTRAVNYSQINSANTVITGGGLDIVCPAQYVSLSGSTTYYLNAQAIFGISTANAYGKIQAVRIG